MRRSARLLLLFGVVFLLATPVFSQAVPLITDRNSAPAIVSDTQGDLHVVWLEGVVGDYSILYSTDDGSGWSDPETVVGEVSVIDLQILVRPDGVPCAVWSLLQLFQSCRQADGWTAAEVVAERSFSATYRSALTPSGELEVLYLEPISSVFFDDVLLNSADEVVTFPEFAIDSNGGYHAFWWDFTDGRGWMWSHSNDGGLTWSSEASLSITLPLAGGTLVGVDDRGAVHLVLLGAFQASYLRWTAESGWSSIESVGFDVPVASGDLAIASEGGLIVVTAGTGGAFSISKPAGAGWKAPEPIEGTGGRSIDSVLVAGRRDGRAEVLWHEVGAVGFNHARVGGETLVEAVPALTDLNLDPLVIATSVAITAGLLFLVPFPAEIFNNTLAEHHDEILGWFRRRKNRARSRFWSSAWGVLVFLAASALLYGFLDPAFGINASSASTFAGLLIGVAVTTFGFALPTLVLRRVKAKEWGRLRALPLALLIGIGCVVLSRLIGFLPGYLYGIVLGVAFTREVSDQQEANEGAVASTFVLALAVGSWVMLGLVRAGSGAGVLTDLVEAALATVVVSGFEALTIGLLPLGGMPGKALFDRKKLWWIVIWGLSVLAFFHALVNPQSGYLADSALVPVATTIGLLVAFTLLSFALWGFFRLRQRRALAR
jgi:hypothetical protein